MFKIYVMTPLKWAALLFTVVLLGPPASLAQTE